jgi:hypothetical protein
MHEYLNKRGYRNLSVLTEIINTPNDVSTIMPLQYVHAVLPLLY